MIIPIKDIDSIKDVEEIKYIFKNFPYREYWFLDGKVETISQDYKNNNEKLIAFYVGEGSLNSNCLYSNKGEKKFCKTWNNMWC